MVHDSTGKERDAETGLDYFGARYFSGAQGRFTSPDAKQFTLRTISSPQKWNKYAYVRNNPLVMVDPDGLDDIYVCRPEATQLSAAWKSVMANAEAHGNHVIPKIGMEADSEAYTQALTTPGAHVVFAGHSVDVDIAGRTFADSVNLPDRDVGTATSTGLDPVNVPDVTASSVAVFACNSIDLSGQYSPATFTGVFSGTDYGTTLTALGSAALAYTSVLATGGTPEAAARAANNQIKASPDPQDHNGDKVVTIPPVKPKEDEN
jgi:RHS repeat-associated protein